MRINRKCYRIELIMVELDRLREEFHIKLEIEHSMTMGKQLLKNIKCYHPAHTSYNLVQITNLKNNNLY